MLSIVYTVRPEDLDTELKWLREQRIYPTTAEVWCWSESRPEIKIGMIVNNDQAVAVKLRRSIQFQTTYTQR